MNDYDLMHIRADTLFTYDARGRMLRTNEPEGRPAPHVFAGLTRNGCVVRFGETVPSVLASGIAGILNDQMVSGRFQLASSLRATVRETLEQCMSVSKEGGGPAYRFHLSEPRDSAAVQLTDANVYLARHTYPWLLTQLAAWWPCFAVVRGGVAVSVCFSSRTGRKACEAGVHTLPAFRGNGYAAAVTAAWGAAIREHKRIPLYSTAWNNLASRRVADRCGLIVFGGDATWE